MAEATFIEGTSEAARYIVDHMRRQDEYEVRALGWDPAEAMVNSWNCSTIAHMVAVDGRPAFAFGVVPRSELTGAGVPWLLSTNDLRRVGRRFMNEAQHHLDEMLARYEYLHNIVSVDNEVSIRWLLRMGFQFDPCLPYGRRGELFFPFHMRRH